MVKRIEGQLTSEVKAPVGIVVSRFNEFITGKLLDGCVDALQRHGVKTEMIEIVHVPGSFEIPSIARRLALSKKYSAVITLGAVIRGGTPHFDYVAGEVSKGVAAAAQESPVPVIFGVLTTDTIEQAIERAGTKAGNKGHDAAMSALEMIDLYAKL